MSDTNNVKSKLKLIIIITLVAVVLISAGIYIGYFQNNKRIIGKAINNIKTDITKYYLPEYDNLSKFDTFTMNNDIKFNINSELLQEEPMTANLINNLNKTKNKVTIKQDLNNKKAYMDFNSTIDDSELFSMKYLIENNTEYYYIKGFLDNYINNGNSNYFESLNKDNTSRENFDYIYNFTLTSFKNHLDKSYFTKSGDKIEIDGKNVNVQKITLELDNRRLVSISQAVLKDLKADDKANKILTGIDSDFKKSKIKNNEKIISKDEKIIFSVYTDNITYIIKKYSLSFGSGSDYSEVCYVKGRKEDMLSLYDKNVEKRNFKISYNHNTVNINMYDEKQQNNGKITITKEQNQYKAVAKYDVDNTNMTTSLDQKLKEVKKNSAYKLNTKLSIKALSRKTSVADIKVVIDSSIKKGATIEEDTDKAIFANDIDNEKTEILKQQLTNTLTRLMS